MLSGIILILSFLTTPALASDTLEELMLRRIAWIVEHSDLEYDGQELPEVVSVPRENVVNLTENHRARGAYDPFSNTIYLWDKFDPMSLESAYFLIHELVHYLQFLEEPYEFGDCIAPREWLAYNLQFQYQEEFGPWPKDTNRLFAFAVSQCEERWGPPEGR